MSLTLNDLEEIYREHIGEPRNDPVNLIFFNAYSESFGITRERLEAFLQEKPYTLNCLRRQRERLSHQYTFYQPAVFLIYYAVSKNCHQAKQCFPFPSQGMWPILSDLGYSCEDD